MRLTRDEILLLAGLLGALLVGAIVKQCRAERRLHPPPQAQRAAAAPPAQERNPK